MNLQRGLITCFLLLSLFQSFGQQQDLIFKNYSVEDGLTSNTIWAIGQDGEGFMWFGTRNGLSRFDGYEFKSYQFSNSTSHSLGNNFIHSLLTYDNDNLWLGTSRGIYTLDLRTNKFLRLKNIGNVIVNDLLKDKDGNIWIATGAGLFKYDRATKTVSHEAPELIRLRKLTFDENGNLWIGTTGFGVFQYNPFDQKIIKSYSKSDGLYSSFILTIFTDKQDRIWVGSFGGGLSLWLPEEKKFKSYIKENSNISSDIVRSLLQVDNDKLLIGTEKGLNIFDLSEKTFTNYVHNPSDRHSLSGNAVYSIFKDQCNGIWLGSYFGGLSYYAESSNGFQRFYPGSGENKLSGGGVSAIIEDQPGKFWIGTEDAGLNYYDVQARTFKKYPFEPKQEPLSYFNILSLEDVGDELWIGTFSGGLNIYNKKTGKVKVYNNKYNNPNHISGNNVHCIYKDKEGVLWVGTSHGLNVYDAKTKKFTQVKELGQKFLTDIYEDDAGVIWFAINGGSLFGKRKKSGDWLKYNFRDTLGFSGVGRFAIVDDHEGHLWLATEGNGLVKFSFRDESFELYGKKHGIDANVIYDILQEDDRKLWLSTNNGIYHFDPYSGKIDHFSKWDNLQSNEFNYNAGYIASDGKMFFGGINGFNTFYPDSVDIQPLKGNIVINSLQLFNNDITLDQSDQKILSQTINYTDHIKLSHDQSVISLEYAALNFENPQKTKYAYKMEGFDDRWNYVSTQRKATYTNLPPGDYIFKVKATNDDKDWNGPSTSVAITIAPPFYMHPGGLFDLRNSHSFYDFACAKGTLG